jgi:hypothetical protein
MVSGRSSHEALFEAARLAASNRFGWGNRVRPRAAWGRATAQQRMLARRGFVALATLPHRLRAIGKIEPFFREVEQMAFVGHGRRAIGEVHRASGVKFVVVFFAHAVELPERVVNGAVG